jgi:heptosyltransferase-2
MEHILIIQTRPGIGDLCIFLSSIHQIAKKNPNSKVTLVTKKRTKADEILKYDNFINNIIFLEPDIYKNKKNFLSNFISLKNFILKERFTKVFIMHYGIRYRIICKLAGIKKIFNYPIIKKNENISYKIYDETKKWLNLDSFNRNAVININKSNNIEYNKKKIVIGIGSSGPTRRWDNKRFINVINFLNEKNDFKFLLAAGKNEEVDANQITSSLSKKVNIESMCNDTISQAMVKIKDSYFYFGTDSAFMHLCAALNIKSFALFGDTPINYAEYSDYIFPITPENYKNIGHNSNAMHLINDNYVCKILEKYLKK